MLKKTKILELLPLSEELTQELITIYGSPVYVYDASHLKNTIYGISQAITYSKTSFHFACVTNGNLSLLKIFKDAGWGLHANTPGDIYLGLKAGFKSKKIVYSGSNLSYAEIEQVLNWGITTLNFDSISQVKQFCTVYKTFAESRNIQLNLGLRLNLPEITGNSRIGVLPTEFSKAIALTESVGLKLNGLHFYRGTGTNATPAFTEVIDTIISVAEKLPNWEYLDFGGGFGYPYHAGGVAFDWQIFGNELTKKLESINKNIHLIIEPGRAAIAGCGTLLAQVVSIKWQGDKQIIGVDSSIANLAVLSVHGGYREIVTLKTTTEIEKNLNPLYLTDICGNTTYSRDYLGKNCQLPALQIGDIIGILDVGAYGYAMSSHFLHCPRPAEVLLENNQHRLIRNREDYSILLNNQVE